MRIKLSPKQAQAWRLLDRPEIAEVFAGGGAGGGKSYLGCLRQIYRRTTYANTRGFIGRESYTALRDSTMKTYFGILAQMGYQSEVHYRYNAQEHTVFFKNGSEQHFRHMAYAPSDPDFNRFGSTEYTDAFVDEAPEIDPRAAQVLLSRLRYNHGKHGITGEILYTGNPGESWIKYAFVMDKDGTFIDLPPHRGRVLFTIKDNPDEQLRETYTRTLDLLDDYDRARLLYGDWSANPNIERPFAFAYDAKLHSVPCQFNPREPLFISLDFNLDPFAIIFANVSGRRISVFGEESITGGTITEGCQRILARFGMNALAMATVTGDYNGTNRSMVLPAHMNLYKEMQRQLRLNDRQFDLRPNPRHTNSRHDVNWLLRNVTVQIDPSCTNLHRDMRTVEVDSDGSIIKKDRSKDAQRADHMDAFRYLCNGKVVQGMIR